MDKLTDILDPQLELVLKLVRTDIEASKFRMESCLLSQLHQMTANLRNMRASMEVCAGPILYDCARANYEHEEGEWYDRWDICGDDDDQAVGVVSVGTGGGVTSTLGGSRYVLKHKLEGHGRCGHRRCRKQQVSEGAQGIAAISQSGKASSTDSDIESQVNDKSQEIGTSEINDNVTDSEVLGILPEGTLKESVPEVVEDKVETVYSLNISKDCTNTEESVNSSDHKCGS